MCGITGFLDVRRASPAVQLENTVTGMAAALRHRGPDDAGCWVDEAAGLALGFRRLAILDLTPSGRQPMLSASGRYVIVFNGEIYNFAGLRAELAALGCAFQGTSDTEVMLAAVEQWGLDAAVRRFNGMFAFALWDRQQRRLCLARDRLGVKPLYYGWMGPVFLFGSELKALRAHPTFRPEVDRGVLARYLQFNYVPAPQSIYTGIRKLAPGAVLTLDADNPGDLRLETYWSAAQMAVSGLAHPFRGSPPDAVEALDDLLRQSVRERMVADVPLGAFLSGGIDSSAIVALMQSQSSRPVKTFTIGFAEWGYDEAAYARQVASRLGTEHTEWTITSDEALQVIPRLPGLYDEPFADASQIPTFLVAEMTSRRVTVSLSGDGGDELFAGYNRYLHAPRLWRRLSVLPAGLRAIAAGWLSRLRPETANRLYRAVEPLLPRSARVAYPADKLHKLAALLPARSPRGLYDILASAWDDPLSLVTGAPGLPPGTDLPPEIGGFVEQMMLLDLLTYLPDDILAKVDRASMGVSLEARVPYLDDHRVVEFAWTLPLELKLRGGQGKWVLRQVLERYLPAALFDRPKMGFSIPLDAWLRGPLRGWAEALLDENRLRAEGFFNPAPIRRRWQQHLDGQGNWQYDLWGILMFQTWLESQTSRAGA